MHSFSEVLCDHPWLSIAMLRTMNDWLGRRQDKVSDANLPRACGDCTRLWGCINEAVIMAAAPGPTKLQIFLKVL